MTSDASGSIGFGVYFRGQWCTEVWPPEWVESGICWDLTFFPVLVAVCIWGKELANQTVHFWMDNLAVVQVVNSLTSRSLCIMSLVRVFTLLCLQLNILFLAHHVPGANNSVADTLSHWQMARFHQLVLEAAALPVQMPVDIWELGGPRQVGP